MEIKSITVHDAATINLGNYESRKLGLEVQVVLGPGEDAKEVINKAFGSARKMLNAQIEEHYSK
jgi:hypothetical protein